MPLEPYRRVLALPGVRTSMLLMFFARLPMTAMGLTLTLHVVSDLGLGYGAAGLVGTATMVGSAIGAPTVGRLIDRHGLRPIVAVCGVFSAAFWISTPYLPYLALLLIALPAGIFAVPAGSIARQVLAALVPMDQRRPAYSLDSISVESSFMIGPSAGIFVVTQVSSSVALTGIGVCFALAASALFLINPPIRSEDESATAHTGPRPRVRSWLNGRMTATLLVAMGALFTLIGVEVSTLAVLRASGEVDWTGLVVSLMCIASIAGGVVHGAVHRSLSQSKLMLLMGLLVIPVGLLDHPWWVLALVLVPTNLLCAPTLAATTETVSALAPVRVRGEAMGLQDSATRIGLALGSPVVGFAIDHTAPEWGFAAAGIGGLAIAAVGVAWLRLSKPAAAPAPEPALASPQRT
ncbi:MAG: transporter [Amycolatopsis sp.]|uniref:MFS transporter n=1 Tax=Amycolatopsis sp. TaxID=37632 RepID=UPI0026140BD7|nr:MFS transporter [Amycolatopsis sp.]MCU1683644.1 transporter [Amycolatopsis sp.]